MATKKKAVAVEVTPVVGTEYDAALKKAADPFMTTAGNPLVEDPGQNLQNHIVSTNMDRLFKDACMRRGLNGSVYAGIMSQRFGG